MGGRARHRLVPLAAAVVAGGLARQGRRLDGRGDDDAGLPPSGPPEVVQLWGISAVLRADSPGGAAYLKCSTDLFRHEAVLTRALAASMPDVLPDVIAVEPDEGWLLMRDMGGALLGDVPVEQWAAALRAYVPLQQQWLGKGDELVGHGAFVRPLSDLAPAVARWSEDDELLRRLGPELRERWLRLVPRLVDACWRLAEVGPSPTLVHGDLHAWNVVRADGGFRYFDWTDAALSHPFVDLAPFVPRIPSSAVRHAAYDAYLAGWADHLSPALLQEAGRMGLVVGCLYVTQTYLKGLPTLMPGDAGPLAGADIDWLGKTLDALDHHLDPRPVDPHSLQTRNRSRRGIAADALGVLTARLSAGIRWNPGHEHKCRVATS